MLQDILLTAKEIALKQEVREFVKREVSSDLIQRMDRDEIMNLLIQHEYYRELLNDPNPGRMIEADAEEAAQNDEKVYEDDEMWTKGW
jgi:hypothetical protein